MGTGGSPTAPERAAGSPTAALAAGTRLDPEFDWTSAPEGTVIRLVVPFGLGSLLQKRDRKWRSMSHDFGGWTDAEMVALEFVGHVEVYVR